MCAYINVSYTETKLAELKKKTAVISGYKVLNGFGEAISSNGYQYGPGTHILDKRLNKPSDYGTILPRGFHFYTNLKTAKKNCRSNKLHTNKTLNRHIVRVQIPVVDIVGLETPGSSYEQGVTNSLFISEREWVKAGLKLPKKQKTPKPLDLNKKV